MTKKKLLAPKDIFLFVGNIAMASIETIRKYNEGKTKKNRIGLIIDDNNTTVNTETLSAIDIVIRCDFSSPKSIKTSLTPYTKSILSVTARGEKNIPRLQKLIPHLKNNTLPSVKSLSLTTNKITMRRRLASKAPHLSPNFMSVKNTSQKQINLISKKIGFPLIVKPAGLASSLLISMCYDKKELSKVLKKTFKSIDKVYKEVEGRGKPEILIEEYMNGDVFSIDVYIQDSKTMYFCPMVHAKNGKSAGFEDFFEYTLTTPTLLSKQKEKEAQNIARKAIQILGLTHSSAHVELMNTEKGWKVVEVGPRIGGFRPKMYELSYDFSHSINDLLNRIPQKPQIKTKVKQHTTVMRFYPKNEGKITSIKGIQKIKTLKSFVMLVQSLKRGEVSRHAKNGGKAVFYIYLSNKKNSALLADIRRVERLVEIITN